MSAEQWEEALSDDALFAEDDFAGEGLDDADAWDLDDADGFADLEGLDDAYDLDDLDAAGDFGDFAFDAATGLHLPGRHGLVTGPAAIAIARRLNPAVLASLHADDSDAFFRRLRRIARGVGRVAGRVARVAGPILRRALPVIQRVVGMAGPWGRLVSAGIGAVQGLAEGRGWRGALAGAIGGAIPGIGGRIASAVVGGQGADDDAALDAMADMADAGQVPAAVALPLGAGLAARTLTRQSMQRIGAAAPPAAQGIWMPARGAEQALLQGAATLPGNAGQRLRLLRLAARVAAPSAAAQGTARAVATALPQAARSAITRVQRLAEQAPAAGASSPAAAARRLQLRRRLLAQWRQMLARLQAPMGLPQAA